MNYIIREIEKRDNAAVESVIRRCLIEYGANHEGTAWADPNLGSFSEVYSSEREKYWVAEDENGRILGGTGIGGFDEAPEVCELQKMYCLPEARGKGVGHALITKALEFAKEHYSICFLETLDNMTEARRFYERHGFERIYHSIIKTEHFACEVRYAKNLR